jgi:RNA polymerase sigma-70 factor (ECF subfamily)
LWLVTGENEFRWLRFSVDTSAEMATPPNEPPTPTALAVSVPPVVIATMPESGASDVDPSLTELRVTFSRPMQDRSWSWVKLDESSFPPMTGQPRYLKDHRTCALPVALQPGKAYAIWINSDNFQNFRGYNSQPAVPYLLIFETRKSK